MGNAIFEQLKQFKTSASAASKDVFVVIEGETMPLKIIETTEHGIRIRYGGRSQRGSFSTILTNIYRSTKSNLVCEDEDEEIVELIAKGSRVKQMGVVPAHSITEDTGHYIGLTFGRLTVTETLGWANRQRLVRCKCTCGGTKDARLSRLMAGEVISCGCMRGKNTELPLALGEVFGRLTIVEKLENYTEKRKNQGYYRARCSCGQEVIRGREDLVASKNPDCGCRGYGEYVGQKFAHLTVLGDHKKVGNQRLFKVRCDCGNELYARLYRLKNGRTKSCGCQQYARRIGE